MQAHAFEHLVSIDTSDFVSFDEADASAILEGQANAAGILQQLGSPEYLLTADSAQVARDAFAAVTDPNVSDWDKKKTLLTLKVPAAVKHLAGMLSEYDWDYIEQAKQLRGYVVAKLLEETNHPDARIRLRAIELTGKLSEVGSFMERSTVTHVQEGAGEIEERLRAKLRSLLPPVIEVQDTEVRDIAIVKKQSPTE